MATLDISVPKGATFSKSIQIKDDNDVPIPIASGDEFRGMIRKHPNSTEIEAEFTFTTTDATNGIVLWNLSATQTSAMASGNLVYDVEYQKSDGTVTRILEGIVESTQEITR